MSEAGSENNDSPFECLTDQDTNGSSGHSHTTASTNVLQSTSPPVAPLPVLTPALQVPLTGGKTVDVISTDEANKQPMQESIINQFTPTSPLLPSAAWVNGLLSRVAETAKNSVDSVITTLDPGMREIIYSGGEVNIVALIDSQENGKDLISAIRDGFIDVFGRVTVKGIQVTPSSGHLGTTIGAEIAESICKERISSVRANMSHELPQNQVVVTIEPFLQKFSGLWYSMTAVYLHDPLDNRHLITHTQTIPIPTEAINWLKCETPSQHLNKDISFSKTLDDWYKEKSSLQLNEVEEEAKVKVQWQESLIAISHQAMLRSASMAVAKLYKTKLQSR